MYTREQLKKMPRATMLAAMAEMNHPYVVNKSTTPPAPVDEPEPESVEVEDGQAPEED